MTTELNKPTGLYLGDQDAKLTEIAKAMTEQIGIRVSRSEAARRIIRDFSLPTNPVRRIKTANADTAA